MSGQVLADVATDHAQQPPTDDSLLSSQTTSSTPSLQRISSPKSDEEWASFLEQYSLGEFHAVNFAVSPEGPPSATLPEDDSDKRQRGPSARKMERRRNNQLTGRSDISSRPEPMGAALPDTDEPGPDFQDTQPDISSSGPANQDPDIPNMEAEAIAADEQDSRPQLARMASSDGNAEAGPSRHGLTEGNMDLLAKEKQAEDAGQGANDNRPRRPRRPPAHARLVNQEGEDAQSADGTSKVEPSSRRPKKQRSGEGADAVPSPGTPQLSQAGRGGSVADSGSSISVDAPVDMTVERKRVQEFYKQHGYMPAPKQPRDVARRRLRVIRRLELDSPSPALKATLDRFTRLATSVFKTSGALVSIIGKDKQYFLSQIGLDADSTEFDVAFCCHTVMGTGKQCLVVPDAAADWRFRRNPLVASGHGKIQFYAGAPLKFGEGRKTAIIGSLCVIDAKSRSFSKEDQSLLMDLAACVVSELELVHSQQATVQSAKLHQISVDFLRRTLQSRPDERPGQGRGGSSTGSAKKRHGGSDDRSREEDLDVYDEASREIRFALDAYAVAVVDLSRFHVFYPNYQNSSLAGTSVRDAAKTLTKTSTTTKSTATIGPYSKGASVRSTVTRRSGSSQESSEGYSRPESAKQPRPTYALNDPEQATRTPQVLYLPPDKSAKADASDEDDQLGILGYSCDEDGFPFNFSTSIAARRVISDFIASNVTTRQVWYNRDDSEGVAASINHLMPPGTETSLAMPVFDFSGQVAFAIVACWTDPLYTHPNGALQFVETMAGSLLAAVMKQRLLVAERAQLNFAAAASHELRTPLHQIAAAASLIKGSIHSLFNGPGAVHPTDSETMSSASQTVNTPQLSSSPTGGMGRMGTDEQREEVLNQLEIIDFNGQALSQILGNIIDTLDIGRTMASAAEGDPKNATLMTSNRDGSPDKVVDLADVIEDVVDRAVDFENRARNLQRKKLLDDVEVIIEFEPRQRGKYLVSDDMGPFARALEKIIHNSCKFTDEGYIHVIVRDISQGVVLPNGYDNSIKLSSLSVEIKDSGIGMSKEFLESERQRPFAKADPFMPGSGLGLGLAQRMIELLGGNLKLQSTFGKGTKVSITLPVHLISEDNESDQERMEVDQPGDDPKPHVPVRQDNFYVTGFEGGGAGLQRLGKCLIRQLKAYHCRLTTDLRAADVVIIPEGGVSASDLAELAAQARHDAEIVQLKKSRLSPDIVRGVDPLELATPPPLANHRFTRIMRPLRPSVLSRIICPPARPEEVFFSESSDDIAAHSDRRQPMASSTSLSSLSTQSGSRRGSLLDEGEDSSLNLLPSPYNDVDFSHVELLYRREPSSFSSSAGHDGSRLDLSRQASERSAASSDARSSGRRSNGAISPEFVKRPPPINRQESRTRVTRPSLTEAVTDPYPVSPRSAQKPKLAPSLSDRAVNRPGGPLRVLVVEDNNVNRRILTTMLKRIACQFAEAVDGEEAVREFSTFNPDLVLLDINMPVKDGFQAAKEMRQLEHDARRAPSRILAVTALSSDAHKRQGLLESGIDEWMTKPVVIRSLRDEVVRLKRAVERRSSQEAAGDAADM